MAYVLEPIVNTSTSAAPLSSREAELDILSVAVMFVGSLMSIIWTASSTLAVTMAYVLEPIVNVAP